MSSIFETDHDSFCTTYDVHFSGDTILATVTADPDTVSVWISEIRSIHHYRLSHLIVGLDVEWRPSFGRGPQNPVATVQICVGSRCLVYQIIHSEYIPQSLDDFLSDEDFTFVGVGVESDLAKLDDEYGIGGYSYAVDLRRLTADRYGRRDLMRVGLKQLAGFVLEVEMEKPARVTTSRWDEFWLMDEQVLYATIDAFVSFEIGRVLNASDY